MARKKGDNGNDSNDGVVEEVEEIKTKPGDPEPDQETKSVSLGDKKRQMDRQIDTRTARIAEILLPPQTEETEPTITEDEKEIDFEKIIKNLQEQFKKAKTLSIDDILEALALFKIYLPDLDNHIQSTRTKKEDCSQKLAKLKVQVRELTKKVVSEQGKNFFGKILAKKERERLIAELSAAEAQLESLSKEDSLLKNQLTSEETEKQKLMDNREALAMEAVKKIIEEIIEEHQRFKAELSSPEVKADLNDALIRKIVFPQLEKIWQAGKLTDAEVVELVDLMKEELAEGLSIIFVMSHEGEEKQRKAQEKNARTERRNQRIRELENKVPGIRDIRSSIDLGYQGIPDDNYDRMFDLVIKELTRKKVEEARAKLKTGNAKIDKRIDEIVDKCISSPSKKYGDSLDLNQTNLDTVAKIDGMVRWPFTRDLTIATEVAEIDDFENIEGIIIRRLYEEKLRPGGRESWDGTDAVRKMGEIGNPKAIPLMLRHVELSGSGHTTNAVVHHMEDLLTGSNPEALKKVMDALPKSKQMLLQALANPDSYLSRYGKTNSRYDTCGLLEAGDRTVCAELLTKILEDHGEMDEKQLAEFFVNQWHDTRQTEGGVPKWLKQLLENRDAVEQTIIDSKISDWIGVFDKLLANLVNPNNGDPIAFPIKILKEGMQVQDERMFTILKELFDSKAFKTSGFERKAFLDGLILLNTKDDGKKILETLFNAYQGSKEDPKRIRKILQLLNTLDSFGEYGLAEADNKEVDDLNEKITTWKIEYQKLGQDIDNLYKELENAESDDNKQSLKDKITAKKQERKIIKDKIVTGEMKLKNLTGLKGIEEAMINKVVEAACKKLELPDEYKQKIKENLDELLKGGLFEIVPALAGKYEQRGEQAVKALLKQIAMHIISGDFKKWRYSHEKSSTQLSGLTEEQKTFWQSNLEPVTIKIEKTGEGEKREEELIAAKRIIANAKEHITINLPGFKFSPERVVEIRQAIKELSDRIITTTDKQEKELLIGEIKLMKVERDLIEGILEIENATAEEYDKDKIIRLAERLKQYLQEIPVPMALLDLDNISKIFTVGNISKVSAFETDDPLTLLKVGVEPQETCQSWRKGAYNECLPAYVADSNKKVVNITNDQGVTIGRSIMKLTDQREPNDFESRTKCKTLLVERPYLLVVSPEVYQAFFRVLLTKAGGLNCAITLSGMDEPSMQIFKKEAEAFGYEMSSKNLEIFVPASMNRYEYSDTLGGQLMYFDSYKSGTFSTLEKTTKT